MPSVIPHLILMLGILFFSSCTLHRLDVQTQYLTPDYLASAHIQTPDPRLFEPLIGQRLLIQWSLSTQEVRDHELFLYLKVRYCNHQEKEVNIPITSKRGTYLYKVNSKLFSETGGILTYIAEIRSSTEVVVTWKHPLWTPLITFDLPVQKKDDPKIKS